MPSMTVTQTITEEDFRKAYATFYSSYLLTRFRPWFGAVMTAFGIYLITSQQQKPMSVGLLFVLLGCFLFLDKRMYVARRLMHARRAGRLPAQMQVELSDTGMLKISGDGERSEMDLRKVQGYQVASVGVLIYLRRNVFFILKEDAVGQAGGLDILLSILSGCGLKEIR